MNVTLCVHLLANMKQPLAGFITDTHEAAYYCNHCLCERLESVLRNEELTTRDVVETITFAQCGHGEPETTCGRCYIGVVSMLTLISAQLKFKTGKNDALLGRRLDAIIGHLVSKYGRISPDNIRNHGKAL
jgi:hypothetical protein